MISQGALIESDYWQILAHVKKQENSYLTDTQQEDRISFFLSFLPSVIF